MKRVDYCIYFVFALLGAHFANAEWVCAKDGHRLAASDSIQINDDDEGYDFPTNCTYDGFSVGEEGHYFEVRVANSYSGVNIAVGVANEPASNGEEAPLKGLFYNDDLFDGNGKTLQKHFGDKVKAGGNNILGTVGVLVKKNKEGGVTVYLIHNSVPLGPALSISNPPPSLYPAVLVDGEATIQHVPRQTSELPTDPEERSGNIINNLFDVTSVNGGNGGTETPQCSNDLIRLRPVSHQELKTEYNDKSQTVAFYVGFNPEDADDTVGYLEKNDDSGQAWRWVDFDNGNDAQRSACLQIVKSVFEKCTSFELKNSRITASSSETGKSFVAMKSEFPTVSQDDFENSG